MAIEKRDRPRRLVGNVTKVRTGCGSIYVTVTRDNKGLFEVFATLGKAGGCATANLEAITRCITLGLRYSIPPEEFIRQLNGIQCPKAIWNNQERILSCADAIAKVIIREYRSEKEYQATMPKTEPSADMKPNTIAIVETESDEQRLEQICPECSSNLMFQEGCYKCPVCGWSKCE